MLKKNLPFFVFAFAVMLLGCDQKKEEKQTETPTVAEKNDRPVMQVTLVDGKQIEMSTREENMILIFFQPDCDHCQHEAEDLEKRMSEFKDYNLYFISSHPMDIIQQFAVDYKLVKYPNIYLGRTSVESVLNNYGPVDAPSIFIYTKAGKLIKSFKGQTPVDDIVNALK
jgi:thioredoxin-related protein